MFKKRKATRDSLDELRKKMPVLSENAQRGYVGSYSPSCIFNVFAAMGNFCSQHFYHATRHHLGIAPCSGGGLPGQHIEQIGTFGGFNVQFITGNFNLSNGRTLQGDQVMMTFFKSSAGMDHAVVAMGTIIENGVRYVTYSCPTFGRTGRVRMDDPTINMFSVRCAPGVLTGSLPPPTGGTGSWWNP